MEISSIIQLAVEEKASDVLITAGVPVVLRINGELIPSTSGILSAKQTKELIYEMLSDEQIAKFEREKELDFSMSVKSLQRVRTNVYLQKGAVAAALRLVPNTIPSLDGLGLPAIIRDFALKPQGFIIVTAPTGNGKSTTQAAMIDIINSEQKRHIVTIEDPIEYVHKSKRSIVDQREVGQDTATFKNALKHVLRQDPDVILIGEIRDLESIEAALTAAETGHLVITTLHTNDSAQSVDRILDVFPAHQQGQIRTQLAFSLLAIIAQRLLPKTDGSGRVCACEILIKNDAVGNLIREGKTHQIHTIMETQSKLGMKTMDRALKDLYSKGLISYEVARSHMRNPVSLKK
jgi:twitching motility protein PilT